MLQWISKNEKIMRKNDSMKPNYQIRFATEEDVATILYFIKELAIYEKMLDEVVAT